MNYLRLALSPSIVTLAILGGACSADPSTNGGTGGGSSSGGGSVTTAGSSAGGTTSSGGSGSSGSPAAGASSGGMSNQAGTSNGGASSGEAGKGGGQSGSGGSAGSTGGNATGGSGGTGGTGGASGGTCTLGSCPPGNAPIPSKGCGKALGTLKTGALTIMSGGAQRKYAIDIPADYDPKHPYRLFFTWHWIGASQDVLVNGLVESINGAAKNSGADNYAFYGLKREAQMAKDPAIFIAPSANGGQWDFTKDGPLFEELLDLASSELCIDTSRVFSTGFSFGAMMSYALSITHQKQLRAVVAMAAANYNLPGEPTDNGQPIAYMGTTGMSDMTCPYVSSDAQKRGGKYCALTHGTDNGCMPADMIPTAAVGSKTHVCFDFVGCKAGYPTKMCTFDGTHQCNVADGGTTNDGLKSWIPDESWKFFSQF